MLIDGGRPNDMQVGSKSVTVVIVSPLALWRNPTTRWREPITQE